MNSRYTTLVLANLLGFSAVIIVNFLSNSLPLNGKTPGELSDEYPNLFVPAGLTFAIWGAIYSVLLLWILVQAIGLFSKRQRAQAAANVENIGWEFVYSCMLNIAWLFAWHWGQIGFSMVIMLSLLIRLVRINEGILNGRAKTSLFEKRIAHTAFGLYQGWITVAFIANITAFLVAVGWQGFGIPDATWAGLMIAVGAGLATYMVWSRNMIFHGLAVIWALLGIYLKRSAAGDAVSVEYVALAGMALIAVAVVLRFRRWWVY
ncbi:MAG: hypothetical protein IT262_15750 [Saprospiraceae bacterium]|nr:hypothetical protein [Saprospiraceae bacterium]